MEPVDIQGITTVWLGAVAVVMLIIAFRIGWKIGRTNVWKRQKGF